MPTPLVVKTALVSLVCSLVVTSTAFADLVAEFDRRCDEGGYADSAEICDLHAKIADENGKPPEVGKALRLRAARHRLWQCTAPASEPCLQGLDRLWAESDDLAEITLAAALYQEGCAQTHTAAACTRASAAAWHGRGVPIDAVASLAWFRQCSSCAAFSPDVPDPSGPPMPWMMVDERTTGARIRALVTAGALTEAEAVMRRALARKQLAEAVGVELADELADARWRLDVEPHVTRGAAVVAQAAADALVNRFGSPRVRARRNHLSATLYGPQVELMRQASAARLPEAARLHALWARGLGADVDVPAATDPFADLPFNVRLTGVSPTCDWLAPWLEQRYRPARARAEIRASLVCTRTSEQRTTTTTTTADETVNEPRTRIIKGECRTTTVMCVGGYKASDYCTRSECTPDREEKYYETVTKAVTRTRSAKQAYVRATVRGQLDGRFGTATIDFSQEGFEDVDAAALAAVTREVDGLLRPVRAAQLATELARAKAAPSALVREEHLLRARLLGDHSPALAEATGLTSPQIDHLLEQELLDLPAPPAQAADRVTIAAPTALASGFTPERFPAPTLPAWSADRSEGPTTAVAARGGGDRFPRPRELLVGIGALRRSGGTIEGVGAGVRIEHGLRPVRSLEVTHLVMVAAGHDAELGPSLDAQAGVATGVRTRALSAQYVVGLGFGVLGIRDATTGARRSDTGADVFHGADLTIGQQRGLALHARFLFVLGGPIDAGTRITGELLYRRRTGSELGLAFTRHHIENGENIVGLGVLFRTASQ